MILLEDCCNRHIESKHIVGVEAAVRCAEDNSQNILRLCGKYPKVVILAVVIRAGLVVIKMNLEQCSVSVRRFVKLCMVIVCIGHRSVPYAVNLRVCEFLTRYICAAASVRNIVAVLVVD